MSCSNMRGAGVLSRRELLVGSALALSGCDKPEIQPKPKVSIIRCNSYGPELDRAVRDILAMHRLSVRGKRVLLKPNFVDSPQGRPVGTNPVLVNAVLQAFRSVGASEVLIGEGPGHRRETLEVADETGYFEAIPGLEHIFRDLNVDEPVRVRLSRWHSTLTELYVARTAYSADILVSLPKMKTHHFAGVTLGMKNLFGTVPGAVYGWPKNLLHCCGLEECIADLAGIYSRMFTIVDGVIAMEGDGPLNGTAVNAGVIVAGGNAAAVDATCCRIMRVNPAKVRHLTLVGSSGVLEGTGTNQIGERIETVQRQFALIPAHEHLRL